MTIWRTGVAEEPLCAEFRHEQGEHIKFKDADGGYCHACWFNGDITDEDAMKRSEHLFKPCDECGGSGFIEGPWGGSGEGTPCPSGGQKAYLDDR